MIAVLNVLAHVCMSYLLCNASMCDHEDTSKYKLHNYVYTTQEHSTFYTHAGQKVKQTLKLHSS